MESLVRREAKASSWDELYETMLSWERLNLGRFSARAVRREMEKILEEQEKRTQRIMDALQGKKRV